MKTIISLFLLVTMSLQGAEKESETQKKYGPVPSLSSTFGHVIEVEVTFVKKPRTYYAQNIVKSKCFAKVTAVNGKKLKKAIVMEYRCSGTDFKLGSVHKLTAYEDIASSGVNREWDGKIRQFNYTISHFLRLRDPALPKAKKPYKFF